MAVKIVQHDTIRLGSRCPCACEVIIWSNQPGRSRKIFVTRSPNRVNRGIRGRELRVDVNKALCANCVVRRRIVCAQCYAAEGHGCSTGAAIIAARGGVRRSIAVVAGQAELLSEHIVNVV